MKLYTRQVMANEAAERWAFQYGKSNERYAKLIALGSTPNPNDVDRTIGNDSWTTSSRCDECGSEDLPVVQLGEPPYYESATAYICRDCIEKALKLFDEGTVP